VDALPRFRAAVAEYPTHEGLVGLLMTALSRSGRQADALTEFRQLRERLFDRHGAAPGPELTALHDAVLRSDRRLADVRRDGRTVLPERAGHALPGDLPLVVGRREQIGLLLDGLTRGGGGAGVVAIEGVTGAGKSALAVHLAHRVAERYPDGQLFLDLGGAHHEGSARMSTEAARTALLRALGADPAASSVAWRELLAHRRLLLVLDNVADAEQVRSLLPGHPGCGAVVTSRTSLAALGAAATVALPGRIDAAAVALQELLGEAAARQKVGGYQEAEAWLHEARRRAERSGLVEALPLIHVRLAQLQHCHRRYADGLASAHEALTLAHRQDDCHLAAQALYALGDVEITRGRLDTAAEFLHGAHVAAVELGERHVAALALGALGTVAVRSGDLTAAFDSHRQATAALAGADPAPVSVDLALRLAETHRAAGHPQEAEALVRSCLELAEHTADLRDTARALSELARCLPASSEAQLYNARATAILRRLGVDEPAVESGRTAPGARLRQALGSH
jgi:tetratricopeptide (TPR) repeat protein